MTTGSQINYEALAQDAMRGLVRTVLKSIEDDGLPGDHHFYIAFDTQADGVDLSKRIKEQYPEEMTIVLQHRFWDLAVREDDFEVKLTFDGIPERLCIPFAAIKVFFDPSVPYGLQFEAPGSEEEEEAKGTGNGVRGGLSEVAVVPVPDSDREDSAGVGRRAPSSVPSAGTDQKKSKAAKPGTRKSGGKKGDGRAPELPGKARKPLAAPEPTAADAEAPEGSADEAAEKEDAAPQSAEVVQLDSFRKKT